MSPTYAEARSAIRLTKSTPPPTCRVLISTPGMRRNPRASQNLHEQSIDLESYIRAGSHHPETGCTTNTLPPHCCSSQRQLLHVQRYLCTRMSSWYSIQIGCRLTTLRISFTSLLHADPMASIHGTSCRCTTTCVNADSNEVIPVLLPPNG